MAVLKNAGLQIDKAIVGEICSLRDGSKVLILGHGEIRRGISLILVRTLHDNKEKYMPLTKLFKTPKEN